MTKLVSLAERPATNEDLHKKIYDLDGLAWEILDVREDRYAMDIDNGEAMINIKINPCGYFWQKPVIVSEEYLKEMEANQIKGRCKDCKHAEYCEWLASDGSGYCSEFEPIEFLKGFHRDDIKKYLEE